jgi:uncharacterized protein
MGAALTGDRMNDEVKQKPRGFATLSIEERKRIASNGGKKGQASGKAHKFTSEEARAAVALRKDRKKNETV